MVQGTRWNEPPNVAMLSLTVNRTVAASGPARILHLWNVWRCHRTRLHVLGTMKYCTVEHSIAVFFAHGCLWRDLVVVSFGNTNTAPNTLIENNKVVVLVKEVIPETGVHELLLVEKTFQKAVLETHFSTESEGCS